MFENWIGDIVYKMYWPNFNTVGLRGKQNIFQIGDFMALGSSFKHG